MLAKARGSWKCVGEPCDIILKYFPPPLIFVGLPSYLDSSIDKEVPVISRKTDRCNIVHFLKPANLCHVHKTDLSNVGEVGRHEYSAICRDRQVPHWRAPCMKHIT